MKRLIIIGAGQMGKAVVPLINQRNYTLVAYGDNASKVEGELEGVPVVPINRISEFNGEVALIAVVGEERIRALRGQLRESGFSKEILLLSDFIEMIDIRSSMAIKLADRLKNHVGAVAELGVYQGDFSILLNTIFPERRLYLFDTFEGFDERDIVIENQKGFSKAQKEEFTNTNCESVMKRLPNKEQVILCKGYFPETTENIEEIYVFVSMDADLYMPTLAGLEWFLPRLVKGGVIMLHDFGNKRFSGVAKAVEDYERKYGLLTLIPLCDLHGTAMIVKG